VTGHVSDTEIDRFSRRDLRADALVRFADHLAECAECQERASAKQPLFGGDTRLLRDRLAVDPHVPEDEVHAYVDRRLSSQRREEIERHLTECPRCADEIRDLQAFAAEIRQASGRRSWSYAALAAAAALLLAIGGTLVWRHRDTNNLVALKNASGVQTQPDTRAEPSTTDSRRPVAEGSSARPQTPPPVSTSRSVVSLFLNARAVREPDSGSAPTVVIGPGIDEVRAQLALDEADYTRYQVALRSAGGAEIFARQHLKPRNTKSGAFLTISLPARTLASGDYLLTIGGEARTGDVEDVSKSLFRVERR
jgi:hypothetical protein